MQNFTLGRKGLNWFLFAFISFVGTLASYGQDCATVTDENGSEGGNQQSFCYLQTVDDIERSGTNTAIFETADTENDTDPISDDELLTNGVTYYVGSTTEDCDRVAVEVTVNSADTPDNSLFPGRNNFTLSPCVSSGFDVEDLENLFTADAGANYSIEVYDSEFGTNALALEQELQPGESYFVAQVSSVEGECPSTRAAVGYDPTEAPAPNAAASQTFCEEATVADLMASGTEENTQAIRWYRSRTSNSPLADNVALINGEDYFAAQIVNDRNDPFPPCETAMEDRVEVIVTLTEGPDAGEDNVGVVCEPDVAATFPDDGAVRDFYLDLLDEDVPTDGTFNPTIDEIIEEYQADEDGLGDFTVTYTIGSAGCEDSVELIIRIIAEEPANAGSFDDISGVCAEDEPIDLTSLENNDPDATSGGTFSGEGVSNNEFDPSIGEGEYTITYSIDDTTSCVIGEDETTFTISVLSSDDSLGPDQSVTYCESEIFVLADPSVTSVRNLYLNLLPDDAPTDGTFEPSISELIAAYNENNYQEFTTTYSLDGSTSCSGSVELSITVVEETEANAGSYDDIEAVCSAEDMINLTELMNNDPDYSMGGTFSGEGVTDNMFDPSIGEGTYTITYSVDDNTSCVIGEDETTFTISVLSSDDSLGPDQSVTYCESDLFVLADPNVNSVRNLYLNLLPDDAPTDGTFEPSISELIAAYNENNYQEFTTTYSLDGGTSCSGSVELSITVVEETEANAGSYDDIEAVCSAEDMINLTELMNNDPDYSMGGTFSGEGVTDNMFDPSIGEGTYTITYSVDDTTSCVIGEDETTFTISVLSSDDSLGPDQSVTYCESEIFVLADPSVTSVRNLYLNLLPDDAPTDGTFEPSISELIAAYNENNYQEFTTTYSLDGGTSCSGSVELSITVVEETEANAGSYDDIEAVCSAEDMINLTELMNNDPDYSMGGTFSGEGVTDNMFDPSIGEGTYTITYSVDDNTSCVIGEDETTFTITVNDAPVSSTVSRNLCVTDAQTILTNETALIAFLNDLLNEAGVDTVDTDGFGDDDLLEGQRLLNFIESPTSDSESFNFSYIDESDSSACSDGTVNISIAVNDLQDADAGMIDDQTICSTGEMIDLTTFLGEDSVTGGTFSGENVSEGMFDTTVGPNEDGYEITYTVDDSADCVTEGTSDSTTFVIFLNDSIDAGADNSADFCVEEIDSVFPNTSTVRAFYFDLLEEGVPIDGTFNPTVSQLINRYNSGDTTGAFTTVYTVTNGSCSDSVELTINVTDNLPAEIGDITNPEPICRNAEDIDLFSFLPADANPNGTFEGYEDGIFSPGMEGAGSFEITYTLTEDSPCTEGEASATFTVTVIESAYAGQDMELSVCTDEGVQNLFESLSIDADTNGEFTLDGEVIADGMMNPADFEAGEYEVVYTVPAINDCGEDSATFNITVEEAPEAPTVDGNPFTFCATDEATGADLSATGTNLTFYSDEALSMMVAPEDALVAGTYYVTQRNDEGGCESEATEITVNINDAATPTISNTTQEFCEFDDATLADLTELINETGTITWYDSEDGDNALNSGTSLQDGVTYYATLFNIDTGCESSVRLAVTVSINDDCPITIPEAFSPNGDGLNDRFEIRNIRDKYPNFTIEIRNRFGDVVYKGNANTPDWDGYSTEGSFGSDILPVGAYFYYLRYNDGTTEPVRGTVYLSR